MKYRVVPSVEIELEDLSASAYVDGQEDLSEEEKLIREIAAAEQEITRVESVSAPTDRSAESRAYKKLVQSKELDKLRRTVREAREFYRIMMAVKSEKDIQAAVQAVRNSGESGWN